MALKEHQQIIPNFPSKEKTVRYITNNIQNLVIHYEDLPPTIFMAHSQKKDYMDNAHFFWAKSDFCDLQCLQAYQNNRNSLEHFGQYVIHLN